ncbi:hypothetical protein MASR1M107_05620 [Ignavibacteriales bacterium]
MQTPEEVLLERILDKEGKMKGYLVFNKQTRKHRFITGDNYDPQTPAGQWANKSYDYFRTTKVW